MSIATLKRKTLAKYNNMSVNSSTGFSLNGSYRNQGYVGQTSLSRSLSQTPMKGPTVRGHGGCCGTYVVGGIVQSGVKSEEDNTVVKSSVLSTKGMLAKRMCVDRCITVKPDNNQNANRASDALKRMKEKTLSCTFSTVDPNCNNHCSSHIGYVRKQHVDLTKPESSYLPISGGQYVAELGKKCVDNDIAFVPAHNSRAPFAGFN